MSCPTMSESAGALSRAIQVASGIYRPLNVTIELSQGCNLRCAHCYNFDRKQTAVPKSKRSALSKDEILKLLGDIRVAGGLLVSFTGGEALLHPHLTDFVREARRLHLAVRIKTNGTLLSEKRARDLSEAGASEIDISLYGATAATHDAFTRIPGSFEKSLRGLINAKSAGMRPQINFIMHRGCVDEFGQMLALSETLDIAHAVSMEMTSRYDGTTDSLDHRLSGEDLAKLYSGPHREYFAHAVNTMESVQCACAKTNAGVGYDGIVYPCIGAPIPSGDLRNSTFDSIWKESRTFDWIRKLSLKDFKSCAPCGVRPYCQRSSGAIHSNTGEYTGPEDWTCRQAEMLKELNLNLQNENAVTSN